MSHLSVLRVAPILEHSFLSFCKIVIRLTSGAGMGLGFVLWAITKSDEKSEDDSKSEITSSFYSANNPDDKDNDSR